MTTETEKKFFKAFGISLKIEKGCSTGISQAVIPLIYPEITDSILIELIKLLGVVGHGYLYCENTHTTGLNGRGDCTMVESVDFKEGLLTLILQPKVQLRIDKKKVRALFEECK